MDLSKEDEGCRIVPRTFSGFSAAKMRSSVLGSRSTTDCESRLIELAAKNQVTTEEEIEEKTLKKRKLLLKDQMAAKIRTWESSNASV